MTASTSQRTPNDFAADLYGKLRGSPGNLLFCPCSVNVALGMALAGARGKTFEHLCHLLGAGDDWRRTYANLAAAVNGRPGESRAYKLLTANRLLSHAGFAVRADYEAALRGVFGGEITQADFLADPDAVAAEVNGWVSGKTNGKITDLINPDFLRGGCRLVLLNATYLLAEWADLFPKRSTREDAFTLADGVTVPAPLMFRKGRYRYGETEAAQHLEIPYKGRELSMLVSLPRKYDGLPALEQTWLGRTAEKVSSRLEVQEVEVFLPRFKIKTPLLKLKDPLCAMGAGLAFSDAADFSGMGEGRLAISDVLHKAYIEVDEEKTEAAAATAVGVTLSCALPPATIFRADRPFRFDIRDNKTGLILFSGRVSDPRR
jgi:serpin B